MSPTETENFKLAVGEELARLRGKRGWSQHELADFSGVPQPTISALERGARMPGLDIFVRICEALGTSPNDVLAKAGLMPEEGSERDPSFWELWGIMRRVPARLRQEAINFLLFREREDRR